MARDFKPVNDRTINDVNQANRAAWDSGEFKHSDAEESSRAGGYMSVVPHGAGIRQVHPSKLHSTMYSPVSNTEKKKIENTQKKFETGKRVEKSSDVRHTPEGGQQLVRGGQVVSHHDATDKCESCGYHFNGPKCDNPGCEASGNVTPAVLAQRKREAGEEAEREKIRGIRSRMMGPKKSDDEGDSTPEERKDKVKNKVSQKASPKLRNEIAAEVRAERRGGGEGEHVPSVIKEIYGKGGIGHRDGEDTPRKAVHLPRRAGRQWRKGVWS